MRRLPIRLRVSAAFAVAMAAVLASTGSSSTCASARTSTPRSTGLRSRANDLAALVSGRERRSAAERRGRFVEAGETYAQVLDPAGRVVDGTAPARSDVGC